MADNKKRMDFYSGVPWVQITPEQARGHPKGKPGIVLWLIALYFIFTGVAKFIWALDLGAGVGIALLNSVWPFLAGVGLLLRVPWSVFLAIVSAALTLWALLRATRATAALYNSVEAAANISLAHVIFGIGEYGDAYFLVLLVEMVAQVGILFYLMDGERPNLIYRHRYRQYSAAKEDEVE